MPILSQYPCFPPHVFHLLHMFTPGVMNPVWSLHLARIRSHWRIYTQSVPGGLSNSNHLNTLLYSFTVNPCFLSLLLNGRPARQIPLKPSYITTTCIQKCERPSSPGLSACPVPLSHIWSNYFYRNPINDSSTHESAHNARNQDLLLFSVATFMQYHCILFACRRIWSGKSCRLDLLFRLFTSYSPDGKRVSLHLAYVLYLASCVHRIW